MVNLNAMLNEDPYRDTDPDPFNLSNLVLPNQKSLKTILQLARLRYDVLERARDPKNAPKLPNPPIEPKDSLRLFQLDHYKQLLGYWRLVRDAHNREVPLNKYLEIDNIIQDKIKRALKMNGIENRSEVTAPVG